MSRNSYNSKDLSDLKTYVCLYIYFSIKSVLRYPTCARGWEDKNESNLPCSPGAQDPSPCPLLERRSVNRGQDQGGSEFQYAESWFSSREWKAWKFWLPAFSSFWSIYFKNIYHLAIYPSGERNPPSCSFFASLCKAIPEAYASIQPWLPQEQSGPSRDTTMWPSSAAQKELPWISSCWWMIPPPIPAVRDDNHWSGSAPERESWALPPLFTRLQNVRSCVVPASWNS